MDAIGHRGCTRSTTTSTRRWWHGYGENTSDCGEAKQERLSSSKISIGGTRDCLHTGNKARSARLSDGSRMTRECHVRFCEGLEVKFFGPTRPAVGTCRREVDDR